MMSQQLSILVIDDDLDLLDILGESLSSSEMKVYQASGGVEALSKYLNPESLRKCPIDAVLSDMNMPQVSGIEVLLTYRALGYASPFVFITGFTDRMKLFLGMKQGAYDFFEKPYITQELSRVMHEAAALGRARRDLCSLARKYLDGSALSAGQLIQVSEALQALMMLIPQQDGPRLLHELLGSGPVQVTEFMIQVEEHFKHSARQLIQAELDRLGQTRSSEERLEDLRNAYISWSAIQAVSNALFHGGLSKWLGAGLECLICLRSFSQLWTAQIKDMFELQLKQLLIVLKTDLAADPVARSICIEGYAELKSTSDALHACALDLL